MAIISTVLVPSTFTLGRAILKTTGNKARDIVIAAEKELAYTARRASRLYDDLREGVYIGVALRVICGLLLLKGLCLCPYGTQRELGRYSGRILGR